MCIDVNCLVWYDQHLRNILHIVKCETFNTLETLHVLAWEDTHNKRQNVDFGIN